MTAAIYVYKTVTLKIENSGRVPIEAYDPEKKSGRIALKVIPDDGRVTLEPGVYRIVSDNEITITGAGEDEDFEFRSEQKKARAVAAAVAGGTLAVGKDGWPDPPPKKFADPKWEGIAWGVMKGWIDGRGFDPAAPAAKK